MSFPQLLHQLRVRTFNYSNYIGVNWANKYGGTVDLPKRANEKIDDTRLVIGRHEWF